MEADKDLPLDSKIVKLPETIVSGPVYSEFYQCLASLQIRTGHKEKTQQTFEQTNEWVALIQVEAAISMFCGRWDLPMMTGEREWF